MCDICTKYVDSKLFIYWWEEAIHKMNKPPCDVEGYCYRKQNNTAKFKKKSVPIKNHVTSSQKKKKSLHQKRSMGTKRCIKQRLNAVWSNEQIAMHKKLPFQPFATYFIQVQCVVFVFQQKLHSTFFPEEAEFCFFSAEYNINVEKGRWEFFI